MKKVMIDIRSYLSTALETSGLGIIKNILLISLFYFISNMQATTLEEVTKFSMPQISERILRVGDKTQGPDQLVMALCPNETYIAVADAAHDSVYIIPLDEHKVLGESKEYKLTAQSMPLGIAFSANGLLLAVTGYNTNKVTVFSVGADGILTNKKECATGISPREVGFTAEDSLLVVKNDLSSSLSTYKINGSSVNSFPKEYQAGATADTVAFGKNKVVVVGSAMVNLNKQDSFNFSYEKKGYQVNRRIGERKPVISVFNASANGLSRPVQTVLKGQLYEQVVIKPFLSAEYNFDNRFYDALLSSDDTQLFFGIKQAGRISRFIMQPDNSFTEAEGVSFPNNYFDGPGGLLKHSGVLLSDFTSKGALVLVAYTEKSGYVYAVENNKMVERARKEFESPLIITSALVTKDLSFFIVAGKKDRGNGDIFIKTLGIEKK